MSYLCPVCNGLESIGKECPSCHHTEIENKGRLVDFMGDYIAYLDYEGTNLIDGVNNSASDHICLHLCQCRSCGNEFKLQIDEMYL